jgi:selenide,water dikinase
MFQLLPDPQTNGGLLFSVKPEGLDQIKDFLKINGLEAYTLPIGRILPRQEKRIIVIQSN